MVESIIKRREEYDLIFMDVQMPILNGLDASRMLHEATSQNLIRKQNIVILTGLFSEHEQDICNEICITDYLQKPATYQQILHVLQKYKLIDS